MNLLISASALSCLLAGAGNPYASGNVAAKLQSDHPGAIKFLGSEVAELFTKEVSESFKGVLKKNYVSVEGTEYPLGFVHASPIPQVWSGTCWTRDAGTLLRELAAWGYFERACVMADYLMRSAAKNEEGFYTFPEFLRPNEQAAGGEMDGTGAIVIGSVMLWQRLPQGHPFRSRIYDFLHQEASPARYIHVRAEKAPLIAGTGEFGGGCGIPGVFCNVVQNALATYALYAVADMEEQAGDAKLAAMYRQDARKIREGMEKYLVDRDGAWIWCVVPDTLRPDPAIINHTINKGFGGLNGPACMYADVLGFEPLADKWSGIEHSRKTFEKLLSFPKRREQFEKYGIWTQFDEFMMGYLSSPSYGHCYALQTMLLHDRLDMADKALKWLAETTYTPVDTYNPTRESRYHFYERTYSPDAVGKMALDAGCAGLNLVNVTEPIKCARLIVGVDDTSLDEVRIIPRVPPSWSGYEVVDWPVRTSSGTVRAYLRFEKKVGGALLNLHVRDGQAIPKLAVRMHEGGGTKWHRLTDVTNAELVSR